MFVSFDLMIKEASSTKQGLKNHMLACSAELLMVQDCILP
jgi:hypothetical protein